MTRIQRALNHRSAVVVCLLLCTLLVQPAVAQNAAAVCTDGYALWADSTTTADTFSFSGSTADINGAVHSNAEIRISGSNNRIGGRVTYATTFADSGDGNSYPAPAQAAPGGPPLQYDIADYRPGGSAALAAQNAGRYTAISGNMDVPSGAVLQGLYYVGGNAKLGAGAISGAVTIVAEGTIEVSGSNQQLTPYADGLLLLANKREPGAQVLKLGGSDNILRGMIVAPGGGVELSGSGNSLTGAVVGSTLKLSGSALRIAFSSAYCPGQSQPDVAEAYAPDEVVVKLLNANDLAAVALANGLDPTPRGQFGTRPIFRLRILDGSDPLVKAGQLQPGDTRVQYAEPNYITQSPEARRGRTSWVVGGDAGEYAAQYAPATIRLNEAHARSRGAQTTVAVLDTGVDLAHPALANRLVQGFDFVDFDADPREEGARASDPSYGHGTHVAGLVALTAPDAYIMPVRVLDREGAGNIWVLAEGLLFAAERGPDGQPRSGDEAQVINMSLGTLRKTQLLADLLREVTCAADDDDNDGRCAASGGVVVVVAAGNGGDTTRQYPAAEEVAGVLALGASTSRDQLAAFSTYGPWVPLAAPGDAITSTVPGGGYGVWSGSSMAAPFAAGVAALVRSAEPRLKAEDVAKRLVGSGREICGPIGARLDAAAALGAPATPAAQCQQTHAMFLAPVSLP
jgi:hypothetical protein